ncbi:MAG: hypothetical protein CMH52_14110 [Myxococcales bacterium]|nr:hypothetical protein [Myxococcales bacterium]
MKNLLKITVLGLSLALAACGDDDSSSSSSGGDTIAYSGLSAQWIAGTPSATFTVCVHGTENCTTTDEDGAFTLEGVAANSEVIFTFVGEDNARIAFPIVTGAEDTTADRTFTVVTRAIADILVASAPGATGGVDDTKSILTFYVGNGGYDLLSGLAGVTASYDGPQAGEPINYIVPIADEPGVAIGTQDVTETTSAGNGFIANIEPGDYTFSFDAGGRSCAPDFAWPGSDSTTFRVPGLEGFATFTFIRCTTEETVTVSGAVTDLLASEPVAGAEICAHSGLNDDGTYADSNCATTAEDGTVEHTLAGDTQYLVEATKDGFLTVIGTFQTLMADLTWAGWLSPAEDIILAAATAGVTVDDEKGHIVVSVRNESNQLLDGYAISIEGSELAAAYNDGALLDPSLEATSRSGLAAFFNVDAGTYTVNVVKEGALCVTNATSWAFGSGYTAPVRANAVTGIVVTCIDTPSPLFGEPEEPIAAPACVEGDAETNCTEACNFFVGCAIALCPGLDGASEWEMTSSETASMALCKETCEAQPALLDIVCQHTTCNETLTFGVTTVEATANACNNGLPTILEAAAASAAAEESNVTQVVGLVTESESVQSILGAEGPMTVFLPVDEAFAALDMGLLEMVGSDPALRDSVLSYHVVEAGLPAAAVVAAIEGGMSTVDTIGGTISLELVDGKVVVGGAEVIATDIFAKNGVIHLIDSVILPPAPTEEEPSEEEPSEEEPSEEEPAEEEPAEEEPAEEEPAGEEPAEDNGE